MSRRTIHLTDDLYQYLLSVSVREPDILRRLREETARLPMAGMQISPEQGQFMGLLARLTRARQVLEIGTFTGYSALVMALSIPAEGRIVTCDLSAEWTAIARRYWAEAGVEDRIELRLQPALQTIAALEAEGTQGFDLAFIDADKENYLEYYERVLSLLRPGGLIMADNTLWDGQVIDSRAEDPSTLAIQAFNLRLRNDERVHLSMLPIGDGLTLALKL